MKKIFAWLLIFNLCFVGITNNTSSAKMYYSVSQTGIGTYLAGEQGFHYEKYYDITGILEKKVIYRRVYDPETFSKKKTAKLDSKVKYYAISASLFSNNSNKSKKEAIYMYRITRSQALSVVKKKGRFVWMRIKSGKIKAIVINAEKTAE